MKNYKLIFILGIILLIFPIIMYPSIINLEQANFISASANTNSYKPYEQIHVTFNYKNTWLAPKIFVIEGELNGEKKSVERFIQKDETITESLIFSAPAQSGNYNINLQSLIELSDNRWIKGDGTATIPITVEEFKSGIISTPTGKDGESLVDSNTPSSFKLIVNSNIEDVVISYNYESKTISSSKTVEFTNIPSGKNFEFMATKDGYEPYSFNVNLTDGDQTVNINMIEFTGVVNDVPSKEHKLLVVTLDKNSTAIQNSRVFIDNTTTQFTDVNGEALFNVTEGKHLVVITNDNYLTITQNYDITQNSKITVRMTEKSDFTETSSLNTNITNTDYLVYIIIIGGMLVILSLIIFLFAGNNKKKK